MIAQITMDLKNNVTLILLISVDITLKMINALLPLVLIVQIAMSVIISLNNVRKLLDVLSILVANNVLKLLYLTVLVAFLMGIKMLVLMKFRIVGSIILLKMFV